MQIQIAEIPVEIVKKKVKHIRLVILPPDGAVRVSAPVSMPDDRIIALVKTRLSWIRKQRAGFAAQPHPGRRQYVSGETLYLWGQAYLLEVVQGGNKNSLVLIGNRAILTLRPGSTVQQREAFVKEWYRTLLTEQVEKYLPKWERITGLRSSGWQSKFMTTRWGTCNTQSRKIWLNLQLAKQPIRCLEYVIVHELAHLKVKNHGPDFEAILDRYMLDWRTVKKQLNAKLLDPH